MLPWYIEVQAQDIVTNVLCILGDDSTVLKDLVKARSAVCVVTLCGYLMKFPPTVILTVWIRFVCSVIHYNIVICGLSIFGYVSNSIMVQEEDSCYSWCACWFVALCNIAKFRDNFFVHVSFVKRSLANFSKLVMVSPVQRMDYRVCIIFNQWYVVNWLRWCCHMQIQWKIVPDLVLCEIDGHGIVFVILSDNIVL